VLEEGDILVLKVGHELAVHQSMAVRTEDEHDLWAERKTVSKTGLYFFQTRYCTCNSYNILDNSLSPWFEVMNTNANDNLKLNARSY
jgi:hypothetical protein